MAARSPCETLFLTMFCSHRSNRSSTSWRLVFSARSQERTARWIFRQHEKPFLISCGKCLIKTTCSKKSFITLADLLFRILYSSFPEKAVHVRRMLVFLSMCNVHRAALRCV